MTDGFSVVEDVLKFSQSWAERVLRDTLGFTRSDDAMQEWLRALYPGKLMHQG